MAYYNQIYGFRSVGLNKSIKSNKIEVPSNQRVLAPISSSDQTA
jgi:hypothetical protein